MECLVTKLKGTVNDDSLFKLGEMRFVFSPANSFIKDRQVMMLASSVTQTLSLHGGYFTDETGTSNLGTTLELAANEDKRFYISNSQCYMSVPDRYSIYKIDMIPTKYKEDRGITIIGDISYLKSLKVFTCGVDYEGDIAVFEDKPLNYIDISYSKMYGDVSVFKDFSAQNFLISDTAIHGDVASLKNLSNYDIRNTGISGDITQLNPNVTAINLSGNAITGDITNINYPELTQFFVDNNPIRGDFSKLVSSSKLTGLSCVGTEITGDVGSITSPLTTLVVNERISGTIEDFVQSQRSSGRTSGSCSNANTSWGNLTFKGAPIEYGNDELTWTSTQITCKGDTITA